MSEEKGLGQLIGEAMNVWRALLDRRLKPLGVSQARWRVLLHVARAGKPLTQSELASRLGIGGPSLVTLLDRMEAGGWIERHPHATDRRRNLVHLSPRAEATMAAVEREAHQVHDDLTGGLDPAEIEAARRVLVHITLRAQALEEASRETTTRDADGHD